MKKAIQQAAHNVFRCFSLNSSAQLLMVSDEGVPEEVRHIFFEEAKQASSKAELIMSELPTGSAQPLGSKIEKKMLAATHILLLTSNSRTHSPESRQAIHAGKYLISIPGVRTAHLVAEGAALEDSAALQKRVGALNTVYQEAERVFIHTEAGTNLEVRLKAGTIIPEDGQLLTPGIINFPCGEIMAVPHWQGTNGTLVIDGVGGADGEPLKESIHCIIEEGKIVKMSGGLEAERFWQYLEKVQAEYEAKQTGLPGDAFALAEFAIGMNSKAWRIDSDGKKVLPPTQLEAEKALGTVHLAVGNNALLLMEGGYGSEATEYNPIDTIHSDQVILKPTVVMITRTGQEISLLKAGLLSFPGA